MKTTKKSIAAATVAASLAVGGLAGAALGTPGVAGAVELAGSAATTPAAGAGWAQDALAGLVSDGTITQDQADAVQTALDEARPGRHRLRHLGLDVVAEVLGITEDDLRTALRDGQTIAEVAAAEGVEVQAVVDAVVADVEARLAERVESGDLTQERADEMVAAAADRVPELLERELPGFGGRHHPAG